MSNRAVNSSRHSRCKPFKENNGEVEVGYVFRRLSMLNEGKSVLDDRLRRRISVSPRLKTVPPTCAATQDVGAFEGKMGELEVVYGFRRLSMCNEGTVSLTIGLVIILMSCKEVKSSCSCFAAR